MTSDQIDAIIAEMPEGKKGFLKSWGLCAFANQVAEVISKLETKWIPASTPPESKSPHHPVQVLAVIDDPLYRINGDDPFVDIASYWPALKKWTVTHQCAADQDVVDYPAKIAFWMYKPEVPVKLEYKL